MELTVETVVRGILNTIQRTDEAGNVAWLAATKLKGWELLGRHLSVFTDKLEVSQPRPEVNRAAGRGQAGR